MARPPGLARLSRLSLWCIRLGTVGLEEIDDGVWSLYYGSVLLARFDEREMKFHG
jgi:hypothetical protein